MQHDKPDKVAMSRALGAAFLSHQIEQLEKSVNTPSRGGRPGGGRGNGKRGSFYSPRNVPQSNRGKDEKEKHGDNPSEPKSSAAGKDTIRKDADIVIVDASVLVYALEQLKIWCKKNREEVIIIPLEVLNTLDMLKKGSSPLAQRARAASRLLEAQVGSNPRIRVQRDDAFVLWDDLPILKDYNGADDAVVSSSCPSPTLFPPPEWLRRTICCVQWEILNATVELISNSNSVGVPTSSRGSSPSSTSDPLSDKVKQSNAQYNVVVAILASSASDLANDLDVGQHSGRYERVDGNLVRTWAQHTGIEILDIEPTLIQPRSSLNQHSSPDKRRFAPSSPDKSHSFGRSDRRHQGSDKDKGPRTSVVEKPIAMSIINEQPAKVLRVLARGEKLDP